MIYQVRETSLKRKNKTSVVLWDFAARVAVLNSLASGMEVFLQLLQLDLADSGRHDVRVRDTVASHAVSLPVARRLDGALPRVDQLHHVPQEVTYPNKTLS